MKSPYKKTRKTKNTHSPLKWKIHSKMIFSDFLKDFFKKKINFKKFVEKWKNRFKNNFLRVSAGFLKGKNGLWKICWKLKKSPKNHFFGLSAGFLKWKNGLWKILMKSEKITKKSFFFGLIARFLKGKIDFDDNWKDRSKIIFQSFFKISEAKKYTLSSVVETE